MMVEHFSAFAAWWLLLAGSALLLMTGASRALKELERPGCADRARQGLQVLVFRTGLTPVARRCFPELAMVPVRVRPRLSSGNFPRPNAIEVGERTGYVPARSPSARAGRPVTPPVVSSADVYPAPSPLEQG